MPTKCSCFYVKANQRDETKEEKGEKRREARSWGAAGEWAAILQQRIRESAHGGVDENTAEADLAEVRAKSLTSLHLDNLQRWATLKTTLLEHCNNKTDLSTKFLPISNLKDANQIFHCMYAE